MDNFIHGRPVVYSGLRGGMYIARYSDGEKNGLGVGTLEISDPKGNVVRDMLMAEHMARTFFWNLDAEAA